MKISNLFKIRKEKTTLVNEIYIGNNRFVIIELKTKDTHIVKDKVINHLLKSDLDVEWFRRYSDFENWFSNFTESKKTTTMFIIIG